MTSVRLGPGGAGKKSLLWLWILLALLAVAVIGGGAYFAFGGKESAPPTAPPPAALTTDQALRLAEKKTANWWAALSKKDVDTLVKLSPAPFYFDQGILLDESQVKAKYAEIFSGQAPSPEMKIDKILAYTIGDLRKTKPEYLTNDRVMNAMKLSDDDIAVVVMYGGEGTIHFFRRSPRDVEMAGFWN